MSTGFWSRRQPDRAHADFGAAEFRGPGTHHQFDDSSDDYEMDMDQRTRFISGRQGGRIILLGDGTEISLGGTPDEDDVDMEDRGEAEEAEDEDLEEQVRKRDEDANAESTEPSRSQREETPGPPSQGEDSNSSLVVEDANQPQSSQSSNVKTSE